MLLSIHLLNKYFARLLLRSPLLHRFPELSAATNIDAHNLLHINSDVAEQGTNKVSSDVDILEATETISKQCPRPLRQRVA